MSEAPYDAWNGSFTAAGVREWRSAMQSHLSQEWEQFDRLLRDLQSSCATEAATAAEPPVSATETLNGSGAGLIDPRRDAEQEPDSPEASHPSRLSSLAHRIETRLQSVLPVALRRQTE